MLIKLIVPFCVLLLTIIHGLSTQWHWEDSSSLLRMDHPGERGDQNLFFAHSILACCHNISYIVTDASRVLLHKQKIVPRVVSAEREMNLAQFSMSSSACVNTALKFSPHIHSRWNGVESAGKAKDGTKDYCKAKHVDDLRGNCDRSPRTTFSC